MSDEIPFNHNGGPPILEDSPYGRDGYIKVARGLRDHPIVGFGKTVKPADDERGFCFSRAEAWQDLIMECRWAPGEVVNKGRKMEIKPGQLLGAISWLAHRWNWTPKTVRWFLDQLQADHMIQRSEPEYAGLLTKTDQQSNNVQPLTKRGNQSGKRNGNQAAVISVCNYEIYQIALYAQRQAKRQAEGQANGNRTASERQPHGNTLIKEEGNNIILDQSQSVDAARETEPEIQPEPGKPWTGDSVKMNERLLDVCGDAVANPVNAVGLIVSATPITWMKAGADVELDIIPALREVCAKYRAKNSTRRISTWDYFTNAVEERRDKRLSAMRRRPPPPAPGKSPGGMSISDIERRDAEEYAIVQQQWSRGTIR